MFQRIWFPRTTMEMYAASYRGISVTAAGGTLHGRGLTFWALNSWAFLGAFPKVAAQLWGAWSSEASITTSVRLSGRNTFSSAMFFECFSTRCLYQYHLNCNINSSITIIISRLLQKLPLFWLKNFDVGKHRSRCRSAEDRRLKRNIQPLYETIASQAKDREVLSWLLLKTTVCWSRLLFLEPTNAKPAVRLGRFRSTWTQVLSWVFLP